VRGLPRRPRRARTFVRARGVDRERRDPYRGVLVVPRALPAGGGNNVALCNRQPHGHAGVHDNAERQRRVERCVSTNTLS